MSDPFLQALDAQAGAPDFMSSLRGAIPGAVLTSGARTPAEQQALIARGATHATHSPHVGGNGFDMRPVDGLTPQQAFEKLHDAGMPVTQVIDETGPGQGTGAHWHFAGNFGGAVPHIDGATSAPTPAPAQAAPAADPHDPFLASLDGATSGGNGANPQSPAAPAGDAGGGDAVGAADGPGNQNGSWGVGAALKSAGSSVASAIPLTDWAVNGRNPLRSLQDDFAGFTSGAFKVPETALNVGANIADHLPYGETIARSLRSGSDDLANFGKKIGNDTNSGAYGWGQIGGEVGATLPLTEVAPLAAAAKAGKVGKLASTLARYGDMALQGAGAGVALSGGHDMGKGALEGAVLAPALGAAGDAALPVVLKAAEKIGGSKLAQGIKSIIAKSAPEAEAAPEAAAAEAAPETQTIRKASDLPSRTPDGRLIVDINGGVPEAPAAAPEAPAAPTLDPAKVAEALGSRASRSGIEAMTDLPPEVTEHVQRLIDQGVSPQEALREADITAAGAKPTVASVTRSPEDQAAMWEGAKQSTPEGRALSAQIAQNNAAVLGKVQSLVAEHGGVPSQGEAAQTAAVSLAKASDAAREEVAALYKTAREVDGDQTARADMLREVLHDPLNQATVSDAGSAFVKGMQRRLDILTENGRKGLNAEALEAIRKAANDAYQPVGGGEVNALVGKVKAAVDESFDQLGGSSAAYKTARAAHKAWAEAYDDPEGVSKLIRRDNQGNFTNSDNWRSAEGFVNSTGDKQFVQVVKQLKANGDVHAVARLKASVLQRAYERATNNARDQMNNPTLSGKMFFDTLNRIGTAKLNVLFEPAELAQIASLGRAAQSLNEAVPGTANVTNTASALARVLASMGEKPTSKLRMAARVAGHVGGAVTGHLGGNLAVEGANHVAVAATEHVTARKLAEALKQSMSPEMHRAAERAQAQRIADALRRRHTTRTITDRSAPAAGALEERRR